MISLTNNIRKTYASLSLAKGRKKHGLFMAQGNKCVADTINHFDIESIVATEEWAHDNADVVGSDNIIYCQPQDLRHISTLTCPPDVIAVYRIPQYDIPDIRGRLVVALDCIQDPGNLGTILRVCDWMGVTTVLASKDTVDVWSPKVVQSTMGAISRVKVHYCDLCEILSSLNGTDIYGTFLEGEDIYGAALSKSGVIVMGNEGKGVSDSVRQLVNHKITIPPYPAGSSTSESLNVAMATGIVLSEFRRRMR